MLGHSQIGLTLNTYSHVLPALQREAAHRIDEAIGGTVVSRPGIEPGTRRLRVRR